jgi:hypothetical protein
MCVVHLMHLVFVFSISHSICGGLSMLSLPLNMWLSCSYMCFQMCFSIITFKDVTRVFIVSFQV